MCTAILLHYERSLHFLGYQGTAKPKSLVPLREITKRGKHERFSCGADTVKSDVGLCHQSRLDLLRDVACWFSLDIRSGCMVVVLTQLKCTERVPISRAERQDITL